VPAYEVTSAPMSVTQGSTVYRQAGTWVGSGCVHRRNRVWAGLCEALLIEPQGLDDWQLNETVRKSEYAGYRARTSSRDAGEVQAVELTGATPV
jgi:hypothetical protein